MHAQIQVGPGLMIGAAPQHQWLTQQVAVDRQARQFATERDRMPAGPQRTEIGERTRPGHRTVFRIRYLSPAHE